MFYMLNISMWDCYLNFGSRETSCEDFLAFDNSVDESLMDKILIKE